jgi:hypothetical protein
MIDMLFRRDGGRRPDVIVTDTGSVEGTNEDLAAARARGQKLGRPPAMTPKQIRHARACSPSPTPPSPRSLGCWASAAPPSTSTSPS